MTHKAKDCVERPRKKGAKYTGKDIMVINNNNNNNNTIKYINFH